MEKLTGRIIRKLAKGADGKKEQPQYFIETGPGQFRRIVVEGEHPYEPPTLHALIGKRCQAEGENYQGKLIVSKENIRSLSETLKLRKK
ncbi:MAG: hypothetical protein AAB797_02465 [Patescibacteria group bacterium]